METILSREFLHDARRLFRSALPKPIASLARFFVAIYAAARYSIYTGE